MDIIKNNFKWTFIFLCSAFLLTGCASKKIEKRQETKTIYFYSKSSGVSLLYKNGNDENYIEVKMAEETNNWWKATFNSVKSIQFKFKDDNGESYNLGGTMGNYPKDTAEDFSTSTNRIWVKNSLIYNYNPDLQKPENELIVLTLNMHTYQEKNQNKKFERIVNAINELKPDIVVLQECAQNKDSKVVDEHYGKVIKADNMAYIITKKLQKKFNKKYNYFWDWSHYGWDVWEEGTAILSKYNLIETANKYITKSHDKKFWKSRNVTMIQTEIPEFGKINVFSAHLGWWDDKEEPFKYMFNNLNDWITSESKNALSTIVCGDFNVIAGSEGYKYLIDTGKYIDAYYCANPQGFKDPTIGGKIDGWENGDPLGMRIDYMFILKGSTLYPVIAQRIFTEKSFGRVSDHCGVYFYLEK